MEKLTGFEIYNTYLAIQRHFRTKGYNYNKYNGKVKTKYENFIKRKDRGLYSRVSYKYKTLGEIKDFFISNFVYNSDFSIYNINEESHENYKKYKRIRKSLKDYLVRDLMFLSNYEIKDICISESGEVPKILRYWIQGKITIESIMILDVYFRFLDKNLELFDDEILSAYSLRIKKLRTFLTFNIIEYEKLITKIIIK